MIAFENGKDVSEERTKEFNARYPRIIKIKKQITIEIAECEDFNALESATVKALSNTLKRLEKKYGPLDWSIDSFYEGYP